MGAFEHFPYSNFHELNLDWVLNTIKTMQTEFTSFISQNSIKYADPIQWNITKQYERNTVVVDISGNGYLSVKAVPVGISIDRTEYWTMIGNFSALWGSVRDGITSEDEGHSTTATKTRATGDLVWLNETLIEVTSNMSIGTAYAIGTNCRKYSMQILLTEMENTIIDEISARIVADNELQVNIDAEEAARIAADNALQVNIDAEEAARIAADNALQVNIDAEEASRIAADNALQVNIDAEEAARIAADNALQVNIDSIVENVPYVNVKDYGAMGNGTNNDTTAIQAAIDACPWGGKVKFPIGEYKITSALVINKSITLEGIEPYTTRLLAVACNGVQVNKINGLVMKNIGISLATRYTTTPNSYTGINVDGDTDNRPFNHLYSNVYIDGFYVAFAGNWLWSSLFDNFKCGYCQRGLAIYGLSVNNVVSNCSLGISNLAGSIGIVFAGDVASEGWIITNTLINDAEIGIYGIANTHIKVSNCILDHIGVFGIRIQGYLTNFGGNWTITNNYIAMNGSSGDCAISCDNAIANVQNRGNVIANNDILVYATKSCLKGISMSGAESKYNIITGNVIKGFTDYDIYAPIASQIVTDNQCLSSITTNINSVGVLSNNIGTEYYRRGTNNIKIGSISVTYDEAIPTIAGKRGDLCINITSISGQPGFWSCVSSGGSGVAVWEPLGIVGAVKLASQSDSTATDVAGLKADLNALLAKLRTAKLM